MKINFSNYFKISNILSVIIFTISILFILFKGLNYGIDFKGGTLFEIKTNKDISTLNIRDTLKNLQLGDVNVKNFGDKGNFLIKVEQTNNKKSIPLIKKNLLENLSNEINFRRVEKVGPKVSSELLKSGIISICLGSFCNVILYMDKI